VGFNVYNVETYFCNHTQSLKYIKTIKRHVRISICFYSSTARTASMYLTSKKKTCYMLKGQYFFVIYYCFDPRSTRFCSFLKLTIAKVVSDFNVNSFEPNTKTKYVLSLYILKGNQNLTGRALRKLDFY